MIKVLVADDHDLVRKGIIRMLQDIDDIVIVGEADCGEQALRLCRELPVDVVLMDVRMPGIGGLEATRKLVRASTTTRVIAVSAFEEDPFPSRLLKAGASGFVTKGAEITDIIQAIRVVKDGQRYLSPVVAQQLALKSFDDNNAESPFDLLSERELQICMMIVNCHKVSDISERLHLSPKTVNSYRYRLFEKLAITSDVELTLLAIRHGMLEVGVQEG